MQKWYDASPVDFKFSVKAPRLITHYKRFLDCKNYLTDFYLACGEGFREKLGCVLFQLHPQIKYSEEFLELIISSIDTSYKNVLEFRDSSWWNENVFNTLKKHNIIFSGISYPKLPDEVINMQAELYYRFHGVPVLYKSSYPEKFLEEKFSIIHNSNIDEAWIYFNNTWGTSAIYNGRYLQKLFKN